jgi:hypothetical protein
MTKVEGMMDEEWAAKGDHYLQEWSTHTAWYEKGHDGSCGDEAEFHGSLGMCGGIIAVETTGLPEEAKGAPS